MSVRLGHSIRFRFFIGFLSLILLFLLMIPITYRTVATLQQDSTVIISHGIQQRRVVEMAFFLNQYAITGDQSFIRQLDTSIKEFDDTILLFGKVSEDISKMWQSYKYTLTSAKDKLAAVREGKDVPLGEIARLRERTTELIPQLVSSLNDIVIGLEKASSQRVKSTLAIMIGLLIFSVILAILFTYAGVKMIIRPISSISEEIAVVSEGDLTKIIDVKAAILGFTFRDEIALMAEAVNRIIKSMRVSIEGIYLTSGEVSNVSSAIGQSSHSIRQSADAQFKAIEESSSSIEEMDASIRTVADDAEELLKATDEASASSLEMSASVSEIAESAEKLAASVDVTASAITEIAASTKQVASNVGALLTETEQVVSATTEVNSAIREIGMLSKEEASLAERVVEIIANRLDAANKSGAAIEKIIQDVARTSSVMNRLGERSKEIGSIVNVINEIADTTNLLALNAAILAAQAGEHGKSFAVVADEVKNLARRTASSTKEIAELIEHVQEEVASAVGSVEQSSSRLVDETVAFSKGEKTALTGITDSSKASLDMARKIEKATEEQTKAVGHVAGVIHKINIMVEEVKRATDEQNMASEEISHATEDMRDITRKVRQSTAEQAKESKLIVRVITDVAKRMQAIAVAMNEQKAASERIVGTIETIRKTTEDNLVLTSGLDKTVDNLASQSSLLNEKVGSFKV